MANDLEDIQESLAEAGTAIMQGLLTLLSPLASHDGSPDPGQRRLGALAERGPGALNARTGTPSPPPHHVPHQYLNH